MATYPPNQTTPGKGSGNYLWNWLGTPLKKFAEAISPYITGGGGVPYKVYAAYVTVDAGNNFSAYRVLENTIGNVTFATSDPINPEYQIILPDFYPRHNIALPLFTDSWADNLCVVTNNNNNPTYRFQVFPGFSGPGYDDPTNTVWISLFSNTGVKSWTDFFGGTPGDTTSVFVEIRVYP